MDLQQRLELGRRIREYRESLGYSQRGFARDVMGCS